MSSFFDLKTHFKGLILHIKERMNCNRTCFLLTEDIHVWIFSGPSCTSVRHGLWLEKMTYKVQNSLIYPTYIAISWASLACTGYRFICQLKEGLLAPERSCTFLMLSLCSWWCSTKTFQEAKPTLNESVVLMGLIFL